MSDRTASAALKAAICDGLLGPPSNSIVYEPGKPQHAAVFYDLDEFEAGLDRAKNAFGEGNPFICKRFSHISYRYIMSAW